MIIWVPLGAVWNSFVTILGVFGPLQWCHRPSRLFLKTSDERLRLCLSHRERFSCPQRSLANILPWNVQRLYVISEYLHLSELHPLSSPWRLGDQSEGDLVAYYRPWWFALRLVANGRRFVLKKPVHFWSKAHIFSTLNLSPWPGEQSLFPVSLANFETQRSGAGWSERRLDKKIWEGNRSSIPMGQQSICGITRRHLCFGRGRWYVICEVNFAETAGPLTLFGEDTI